MHIDKSGWNDHPISTVSGRAGENSSADGGGRMEHAHRAAPAGLLGQQRQPGTVVVAMAAGPEAPRFLRGVTPVVGLCPGWLSGWGRRG